MAKKPKKQKSNKPRWVSVTDNPGSPTIDVKLYRLIPAIAAPYMRGGTFSFKVAFDRVADSIRRVSKDRCPIITIQPNDVLQTENETIQRVIERFHSPQKTERNGSKRPEGFFFEDVTDTETEYDIDLDEIVDAIEI